MIWRWDERLGNATSQDLKSDVGVDIKTSLQFDPPKDADTPQNNTRVLQPANVVETGSRDEQLAAKAKMYLERVIDEHPGTPLALLAQKELQIPIGWKWRQTYIEPPRPQEPGMNSGYDRGFERRPMMNRDPKQVQPIPRL